MDREKIKSILEMHGAGYLMDPQDSHCLADAIEHLVGLVEAACADVCDEVAEACNKWEEHGEHGASAAMECAAKIRAM